jgi:glycosyltransferase involved in cell wall biosynthesis
VKVLIFNWRDVKHPDAGGAEIHIHEQAKRWVDWGHEVTLFTSRPEGSPTYDEIDGVKIVRGGGFYSVYPRAALAYITSLRKQADVLLDLVNGIPFFTPAYSGKPKVGLMHHVHRQQFLVEMGPVLGRIGQAIEYCFPAFLRYDSVVCISKSTADEMKKCLLGAQNLPLQVVYPGIDHSFFGPGDRKFSRPTILYLGRIKKYKRLDLLLSMMPAIQKRVEDVELLVAGKGDALEDMKRLARKKGLGDYIRFLGHVSEEEKLDLYRKSWVLAMPSMNEGWGMNVIEANACGTPCVAYRVPGLDESIAQGKSGYLADDDDQFSQGLLGILDNQSLREELSSGAIEWASRYNWDNTARQTLSILEKAALS